MYVHDVEGRDREAAAKIGGLIALPDDDRGPNENKATALDALLAEHADISLADLQAALKRLDGME